MNDKEKEPEVKTGRRAKKGRGRNAVERKEEQRLERERSESRVASRPCEKPANKGGWDIQTHRNSGTIYSEELLAAA